MARGGCAPNHALNARAAPLRARRLAARRLSGLRAECSGADAQQLEQKQALAADLQARLLAAGALLLLSCVCHRRSRQQPRGAGSAERRCTPCPASRLQAWTRPRWRSCAPTPRSRASRARSRRAGRRPSSWTVSCIALGMCLCSALMLRSPERPGLHCHTLLFALPRSPANHHVAGRLPPPRQRRHVMPPAQQEGQAEGCAVCASRHVIR